MENEKKKLFLVNPKKAMKFCIYQGQMLTVKCNQISTKIKQHGGIVVDYEDKDSECIILSHKTSIPKDEDVFNIKYIQRCISQNVTLNLLDYRISEPLCTQQEEKNCISIERILNDEKCIHRKEMTAEQVLEKLEAELNL